MTLNLLISDSAILSFGANSEITVTHVHDVGLTITNTIADTDNRQTILQLKSEEDAIVADDVIASIEMAGVTLMEQMRLLAFGWNSNR